MNLQRWNPAAIDILLRTGWSPGRNLSLEAYDRLFAALSLPFVDEAREVLKAFDGLSLECSGDSLLGSMTIVLAEQDQDPQTLGDWADELRWFTRHIGEPATPIGDLTEAHILVTESAQVYALHYHWSKAVAFYTIEDLFLAADCHPGASYQIMEIDEHDKPEEYRDLF
jgi:hypothetical protein